MSPREIISAGSALQTLVHQFSDPLSFYRELVQNALDAGSRQVDIEMDYNAQGQTVITVEDSGMGMTSEIIDSQLTCLFSSRKDDDLTLIGKFGIGFVSVFALDPELVTVETARDGEAWKIVFFRDGRFERSPLGQVREGTRISLFKNTSKREFLELKTRSREVLLYWCKHINGELSFCGERLERKFGIEVDCPLTWSEPDTEIQLGYPEDFHSFIGFYNQGLTLLESETDHVFPGLVVKINSRFLEHTLTRDQVVQDEHFAKLMKRVGDLIENELPQRLFLELEHREDDRWPVCQALTTHYGARPIRTLLSNDLEHSTGEALENSWVAWPQKHQPGLMGGGPSVENLDQLRGLEVVFRLRLPTDNYTSRELPVAQIKVATPDKTALVHRDLTVEDFRPKGEWTEFILALDYGPRTPVNFCLDWPGEVPLLLDEIRLREPSQRKRSWSEGELQSLAFRTVRGEKCSLGQVLRASQNNKLAVETRPSLLTDQAENSDMTVLKISQDSPEHALLQELIGSKPVELRGEYVFPQILEAEVSAAFQESLSLLAQSWNIELTEVLLGRSCCDQNWPALLIERRGQLERLSDTTHARTSTWKSQKRVLVINDDHTAVQRILSLATEQPPLAAFLLFKHFFLQDGISAQLDADLALSAWRQMNP